MGLATGSIAGLFWGLHDWAHFHNHGPFEERAWTELQCDVSALVWLEVNREALGAAGVGGEALDRVRREVAGVARARFAEEGREAEFDAARMERGAIEGLARRVIGG